MTPRVRLWLRSCFFGVVTLLGSVGCTSDLHDLEYRVAALRELAEMQSGPPVSHPTPRRPQRMQAPKSPFLDGLASVMAGSADIADVLPPRFSNDMNTCMTSDLEFRGWIQDAGRIRAWVACPGKPLRAVAQGEVLDATGVWVASISRDQLWLYPGPQVTPANSILLAVPLRGREAK